MFVWHNSNRFANPGQTVSIQTLATIRREPLRDDRLDRADPGAPGGARGHGRGDLPRQGAGHARSHAGHRPVQRRDRPGQARRAAGARAGLDRLRLAAHGIDELAGRDRPAGPLRLVPDVDRLRRSRLLAGLDPVGLGPKNPRSADDDLFDTDSLADQPRACCCSWRIPLDYPSCQLPRRLSGNGSSARILTTSPSHPTRIPARSD